MTSTDSKPPRAVKPESLEAKFGLLCRLPYDQRVRRKHVLVFGFILDWYHSKYGDALASVRHVAGKLQERDPAGKGLYIGEVHAALTDLVEWDYLLQEKGKGRRASRYVPNWSLLEPSVQQIPNATDDASSVLDSPNTGVLDSPNATGCSVHKIPNEDPSTMTRSLDPGTWKDELDCAAPTAPPLAGLAPATAQTAQEDSVPTDPAKWFDHLYVVYGVRAGKADARRRFEKIAPNLTVFTGMIDAARKWRAAAGEIERMGLARWLRDEKFDEDPRQPRKERAVKPSNPATSSKPAKKAGPTSARITAADVVKIGSTSELRFSTTDETGAVTEHAIIIECDNGNTQYEGQQKLKHLVYAAGLNQIEDSAELLGRTIIIDGDSFAEPICGQPEPDLVVEAASNPTPASYLDDKLNASVQSLDEINAAAQARYEAEHEDDAA